MTYDIGIILALTIASVLAHGIIAYFVAPLMAIRGVKRYLESEAGARDAKNFVLNAATDYLAEGGLRKILQENVFPAVKEEIRSVIYGHMSAASKAADSALASVNPVLSLEKLASKNKTLQKLIENPLLGPLISYYLAGMLQPAPQQGSVDNQVNQYGTV